MRSEAKPSTLTVGELWERAHHAGARVSIRSRRRSDGEDPPTRYVVAMADGSSETRIEGAYGLLTRDKGGSA